MQLFYIFNVQDLLHLRSIDLSNCNKLWKIPDLSGAINHQSFCCNGCENLVKLPCLNHLASLEKLDLSGCKSLRKILSLSRAINLQSIFCNGCENLIELPCLNHLASLEKLGLSDRKSLMEIPNLSGVIKLQSLCCNGCENLVEIHSLNQLKVEFEYSRVESVSSNISKLESLGVFDLGGFKRLKTLSELPRYLWCLNANYCTSLEKVSFTDHNSNSFFSLHDGDDTLRDEKVSMSFLNGLNLNQYSIKNIESNAMLQIQSLAQRWARRKGRDPFGNKLLCCIPGNEVSANQFEQRSVNSRINLKIAPNGCSGSRFLAFALCFLADLSFAGGGVGFFCKYQLTAASGEKFMRESRVSWRWDRCYR
ncbi:disease resistance protein TAO1-like [Hibiscus syriacus]|uniref:disease resistance protein TAO1-like n=1 Tax=Hibiscus syriacus TaxID=106335 RepID=UPI001924BE30|nr:disease resistance protein TAO1-like [Hibiscus syriacus]